MTEVRVFDTIGLDPDAEAGEREARSAAMTLILLGSTGAAMFIAGLLSAAEVVIAAAPEEIVFPVALEDPPQAPPAPPAGGGGGRAPERAEAPPTAPTPPAAPQPAEVSAPPVIAAVLPTATSPAPAGEDALGAGRGGAGSGAGTGSGNGSGSGDGTGSGDGAPSGQRVGSANPKRLGGYPPLYPRGETGSPICRVALELDPTGTTARAEVTGCPARFAAEVQAVVGTWRFSKTKVGGRPVPTSVVVKVAFVADGGAATVP